MPDSASASFAAGLATVRGYWERLPPEYQDDFTKAVDDLANLAEAQVKSVVDAQAQKFGGPQLGGLAKSVTDAALAKLYAQLREELAALETQGA